MEALRERFLKISEEKAFLEQLKKLPKGEMAGLALAVEGKKLYGIAVCVGEQIFYCSIFHTRRHISQRILKRYT